MTLTRRNFVKALAVVPASAAILGVTGNETPTLTDDVEQPLDDQPEIREPSTSQYSSLHELWDPKHQTTVIALTSWPDGETTYYDTDGHPLKHTPSNLIQPTLGSTS